MGANVATSGMASTFSSGGANRGPVVLSQSIANLGDYGSKG